MDIISRARWAAQYGAGFGPAPLPARELWLHHSVTAGGGVAATFATDAAGVRLLEQIGQTRFGGGISYTFVVTESGRVFEGHGVDRKGAHTGGRNSVARAICLLGNYSERDPTAVQLAAVAELVAFGHARGWWTSPKLDGGHRDAPGASTECPGDRAHARIAAINSAAASVRPVAPEEDNDVTALTPEQDAMLRRIHHELTLFLPDRRGPQGQSLGGKETVLGYAANADGFGYRAAWTLAEVMERLDELAAMTTGLAERIALQGQAPTTVPEIDYARLAAALLQAVGR